MTTSPRCHATPGGDRLNHSDMTQADRLGRRFEGDKRQKAGPNCEIYRPGISLLNVGTTPDMTTVWALLVVSSEAQSETLRHQRTWAEGLAKDKGWRIARLIEGVASGNEGPRRLSRDLLLEVRATPIEARPAYVLMIRLDRIGRGSIVDSQIFVRDLLALGTRVYTRNAGEIRLDSAMDELVAAVQMAVARHENDVRRDKMRAVYQRRLAAGQVISNRPPYGLLLTLERRFVARRECIPAIRQAFKMSARGARFTDIVDWLQANSEPHRCKNGRTYEVRWSDPRLRKMFQNRAYIGTVVDQGTWLRAQRPRVKRTIGRVSPRDRIRLEFELAGVFRCICGMSLSCVVNRTPRREHPYYVCRAGWTHKKARYHRASDLERRFLDFLQMLSERVTPCANPPAKATIERLDGIIERLRTRLVAVEQSRARIWYLDDRGHLEPRDLAERLANLDAQKADIEGHLVARLEERAALEESVDRDADAETLRRDALAQYLAASPIDRSTIGRAVAGSLGGLRVTASGQIVIGARQDHSWQRTPRFGEGVVGCLPRNRKRLSRPPPTDTAKQTPPQRPFLSGKQRKVLGKPTRAELAAT